MIIVVDSGATRAEWVVINDYHISETIETDGFNPYFTAPELIFDIIEKGLVPYVDPDKIDEIYFYGAGCSTVQKCSIIEDALVNVFHKANCEINHDLLGAARALFGRKSGIACILGTGSNSCYYDGKEVAENVPSLGFLFGDEGSGASLGRLLLQDYLKGNMPDNATKAFESTFNLSLENILDAVYKMPHPNSFLASFALFIGENKKDPYFQSIINKNFEDFLTEQVMKYKNFKDLPLGVIGSVGFHFEEEFQAVAKKHGLKARKFMASPIDGLVKFHLT